MAKLEIAGLRKTYEDFTLGPLDLQLEAGTVHGLVGPNGAGKSTLFRCIMGTVRAIQGEIRIDGEPADHATGAWKQSIGYIGDYEALIEHWSGARNLSVLSGFYDNWSDASVGELASRLDLDLDRIARTYSTGQRTKLAIIHALAHGATLLLLDEPAAGLDPVARDALMEILFEQMLNEELTILYATHHVSEIEQVANELIFIDSGAILGHEARDDLERNWRRITFRVTGEIGDVPHRISQRVQGYDHEVITSDHLGTLAFLEQSGAASIQSSRMSIEQICVQLLKHQSESNP